MLRKSHSTDWHAQSMVEKQSEASVHSMALQQHFEELKAELADFSSVFSAWLGTRRHALTDDKEAFLRTLAEEQGLPLPRNEQPSRCRSDRGAEAAAGGVGGETAERGGRYGHWRVMVLTAG